MFISSRAKVQILVGDLVIILVSFLSAYLVRLGGFYFSGVQISYYLISGCFLIPMIFYILDLYEPSGISLSQSFFARIIIAGASIFTWTGLSSYIFPSLKIGRGLSLIFSSLVSVLVLLWRMVFIDLIGKKLEPKKLLIIGDAERLRMKIEGIKKSEEYKIINVLNETEFKDLENREKENKAEANPGYSAIVIDSGSIQDEVTWEYLLRKKLEGKEILEFVEFYEKINGKSPVTLVNDRFLVYSRGFVLLHKDYIRKLKRIVDVGTGIILLVLTFPLMALIALAIKLDSKGPVFYKQKRLGLNEKEFDLVKFRTMRANAESETGAVWADENDNRITRVGKILRKTRLDELPQLINIFREEMSFVGPRPERPEFVKDLKQIIPYYSLRHSVKPGLTGWAQVNYRYGSSIEETVEKLRYDLYYIKNMNILLDLWIIIKTIKVMLRLYGAR